VVQPASTTVEDEAVLRIYTIPTTPQRAAALAFELTEQLEPLAGTQVETTFGVLHVGWAPSSRWGRDMPTVAGKLRMPGMRKVWDLEFAADGPPQAWLPIVRGCDGLSRAQERALEDLMNALGEWYQRTQEWTVGAVGYGSSSLVALESLAAKEKVTLGVFTKRHYQRIFDDLTIAMLPVGSAEREIAVQLRQGGWDGSMKDLLATAKLLAAAS
jgi:hypothetical protein